MYRVRRQLAMLDRLHGQILSGRHTVAARVDTRQHGAELIVDVDFVTVAFQRFRQWIADARFVHALADSFEDRLGGMMRIACAQEIDMHGQAGIHGQGAPELFNQRR